MFLEPKPSPLDLRWRMFGIGVRVHPTFWLFSLMMGYGFIQKGVIFVFLWVAASFLSILVHELGHVIAGRIFGQHGNIVLYSFGGLAVGSWHDARRWQRIIIMLAGPAAGFALYGLVTALDVFWFREAFYNARFDPRFAWSIRFLKYMNLFWSIMNLIPVFPMDGGQVLREVTDAVSPRRGERWAFGLSFVIGGLVAIYSVFVEIRNKPETPEGAWLYWPSFDEGYVLSQPLSVSPLFTAILFGVMALQCLLMLREAERRDRQYLKED